MQFSVLMSVYYKENPQRFKEALKSNITDQKRKPDQLVLVCDGPLTKELDEVIEEYNNKYPEILKVCRLEGNGGLGRALKYGLEQCDYDLVARSDSDDVCTSERFELQVEFMKNNPDIVASSGTIDEFSEDHNCPQRIKHMPLSYEEVYEYAKRRNPLNHMATIFRKKDVLEVGSYEHLQYLEDYYLWVRLLVAGKKLENIDDLIVHACVGNGMIERRGDKRYIKSWKVLGKYMLDNKLQSSADYVISIAKVAIWCYMPGFLRALIYDKILRQ